MHSTGRYVRVMWYVNHCATLLLLRVSEYISLLINMVHYNAAYLDRYVCDIAKQPDSSESMGLFLDLLNAIVCYSSLPVDALVAFATTLCHTLNVERFCEKSWGWVTF